MKLTGDTMRIDGIFYPLFEKDKKQDQVKDTTFLIDFVIKDKITYTPIKKMKNIEIKKGIEELNDFYKSKCK